MQASTERRLELYDGLSYIPLYTGGVFLKEFMPNVPPPVGLGYTIPNVTESPILEIRGSNDASIENRIRDIQRMLVTAQRRWITNDPQQVFALYTPQGSTQVYRSELAGGEISVTDRQISGLGWKSRVYEVALAYERQGWWEYNTEQQIPLTNGNGNRVLTALPIYDCSDGVGTSPTKRHNYVEVDGDDIDGMMDSPVRLEFTSPSLSARRVYIGSKAGQTINSIANYSTFPHIQEAEAASRNPTYASTPQADATCSGGFRVNISALPASAVTLLTWTLLPGQLVYAINTWVRIIARFSTRPSNSTIQTRVSFRDANTTAVLQESQWETLNTTDSLQVLATLLLSPTNYGIATYGAVQIVLEARDSAAAGTFQLDYLELAPIKDGAGFRFWEPIDEALVTIPTTGGLFDNPLEQSQYIENRQKVYRAYGGYIMAQPNIDQRWYFLWDGSDGTAAITRSAAVRAFYRPRFTNV